MILASKFFFFFFFFSILFSPSLSNSDINTLLSFKASLISDPHNSLSSWRVNSTHPSFDSWFGVTCNSRTHRVIKLVLENLNLTGSAQPLSQLTHLRLLSLKYNYFSSSNLNLSSWPNMKHLYLSHNQFNGIFPTGIVDLHRLLRLDLSYNHFTGEIPMTELSRLPKLLTLRLEDNSFTGTLDSDNLSSLSILDFNVSDNRLTGQIPTWLSRFPVSSFTGNKYLCGGPLDSACPNRTVEGETAVRSRDSSGLVIVVLIIVIFEAIAMVAAIVTVTWYCYKRTRRQRNGSGTGGAHKGKYGIGGGARDEENQMVMFDFGQGCSNYKVDDLLKSSADLLGKGSVGTTYKVKMDGSDAVVVVKRVRERKKRREVDEWLCVIGGVTHSNIVSLRAYFNSNDELLLVYDFLPNGSLHSLLHENRGPGRTPLDWSTRLKLASDAAKGLAFLHSYNKPKLFHGNLTSSNIVVDQSGNARISDIGLQQLLHTSCFIDDAYKAPELKLNNNFSRRKFTHKCDVYSFGVLLLEILTGKIMSTGDGESSIVKWVRRQMELEENPWEVFDFELLRDRELEEEMRALLQVAFMCLAALPKDRPKMSIIHRMIEDIRTKGSIDASINSIRSNLSSDSSADQ